MALHYPACQEPIIRNKLNGAAHQKRFLTVIANRNGAHYSIGHLSESAT